MSSPLRLLSAFLVVTLLCSVAAPTFAIGQRPDSARGSIQSEREQWLEEPLVHPDLSEIASDTVETDTAEKDAPFVPTPRDVVVRMLEVADVGEKDVVYDLGSGDGRIPILAAEQFGARGIGVEIDSQLVAQSRAKARDAGVQDRVEFRRGDLFKTDLSDATVVALYLWPEINRKLRPKLLRELDPGDRVVSHDFGMGDWEPDRRVEMKGKSLTGQDFVYLWVIPEEIPDELLEEADGT